MGRPARLHCTQHKVQVLSGSARARGMGLLGSLQPQEVVWIWAAQGWPICLGTELENKFRTWSQLLICNCLPLGMSTACPTPSSEHLLLTSFPSYHHTPDPSQYKFILLTGPQQCRDANKQFSVLLDLFAERCKSALWHLCDTLSITPSILTFCGSCRHFVGKIVNMLLLAHQIVILFLMCSSFVSYCQRWLEVNKIFVIQSIFIKRGLRSYGFAYPH